MKLGIRLLLRSGAAVLGAVLTFKLVDAGERIYANAQLAKGRRRREAALAEQPSGTNR